MLLKSRPSPPKPNEKPNKQHAPEPAVPDSAFFMADLPEPIIYDRGNSGSKKQGGSSHRTSYVYQSSKPRDPNCPRYTPPKRPPHYSPPKRPEMPFEHQGRSSQSDYSGQHSNNRHFAQKACTSKQGVGYPPQGPTKRLNSDQQRPADPHRKRQKTHHNAAPDANIKNCHQNRRSPTDRAAQIDKFNLNQMPNFEIWHFLIETNLYIILPHLHDPLFG